MILLHLRPSVESITGERMESNCSMIEKIPPKGVSFSDFICGSSGIWSDGHNLHYINSKHDEVQLRTVGNSLILSCSILVES